MIGILTTEQMVHVLRSGLIGRIGCCDGKNVYVMPVTYVFDDNIETMINWRCVMVHGTFQELKTPEEQEKGLAILKDRLMPYLLSETMRPRNFDQGAEHVEKERRPVVYRIRINTMTGRYEKNSNLGSLSH